MRKSALPFVLTSFSGLAQAQPLTVSPHIQASLADVYLTTREPTSEYGSTVKRGEARLDVQQQSAQSELLGSFNYAGGLANDRDFNAMGLRGAYRWQAAQSSGAFDLYGARSEGSDPERQLIEQAAAGLDTEEQAIYAGLYQQMALGSFDTLSAYIGGGQYTNEPYESESAEIQFAWDRRISPFWGSRVRVRATESEIDQREIVHELSYRFSRQLTGEAFYGFGWQDVGSYTGLWGGALEYRTAGLFGAGSAYQSLALIKELSAEEVQSLRGSSAYRIGLSRSRDQRRVGDSYFYSDLAFASARIEMPGAQSLDLKGSLSRASTGDYEQQLAEAQYGWKHRFVSRYPEGELTAAYQLEITESESRRYFREIYRAGYALSF